MKKLALLFVFVQSLIYAQGEQRYADGTATDQDGYTFEWINYGTQDWAIENAEVVTYRDGTPIPQVTDASEWANLTTGAWCYYDNDPTKGKLYNWYAVAGIHDNDPNTPNKEYAPVGWHVPTDAEWTTLEEYLIASGYNYDGTTTGNKIAKSLASTDNWLTSGTEGAPGCTLNNEHINNSSGFNAYPSGQRRFTGNFEDEYNAALFWSSSERDNTYSWPRYIYTYSARTEENYRPKVNGFSIRFVRDAPNDTQPPAITLNGANPISVNQGDTYTDPGATASDNFDGDLTSSIVVSGTVDTNNPGTYIVTYSVTDTAGNTSTATRTVIVLDTQPPVFTIFGANPITVNQGAVYNDPGATATDNVDGDITANITVTSTVDTSAAGAYTVTYNVSDAAGNTTGATRIVNVVETTPTLYAGRDLAICENETVTLGEATASNYSSLYWTTSGDGTFDAPNILNSNYTPGPNDIITQNFNLSLIVQGSNGQEYIDTATISITSLPTVNAGNGFAVNEGETIQLSEATASNYSSLYWVSSGTGTFNAPDILNPIYTPSQQDTINGSVTLTMTASSIDPCTEVVSYTVTITIINSNPTLNAGPDLSVCQAEDVTITGASASNISSFDWTTNGSGTFTDANSLTPTYTPGAADIASGFVILTLTAYGNNNQQVSDEIQIVIEPCNTDILLKGTVSAENNQIKNVADPTDAQDAATKAYADAIVASRGLMNFSGWDNYQVWNDNTTVNLTPNSFVFLNADNTTLVLPDNPENCCFGDVIYVYVMRNANSARPTILKSNNLVIRDRDGNQASSGQGLSGVFQGGGGLQMIINVGDYWMAGSFESIGD